MATLSENLITLNETKQALKTAIEGKGQDLTNVPFTGYAEKITAISVDEFTDLLVSRPLDREVELTIPNGIKYLGEKSIAEWYKDTTTYGLRKINLNGVETVGPQTLINNKNLIEVNAPNLRMLSYDFLFNARSLTKVYFPNVVDAQGGNVFRDNQLLQEVRFDKAEVLNGSNFVRCYKLDTLVIRTPTVCTLKGTIPTTNTCFAEGTASIFVPDNLVNIYKVATNWSAYSAMIKPLSEYVEV